MNHAQPKADLFEKVLSSIRTKLPIQNPLHGFVHNNILQMFEGKDFHDAVKEAGHLYRANPYWPEARYTDRFREGKIIEKDIFLAIDHYQGTYQSIASLAKLGLTPKEFFYRLMFSELAFNDDDRAQPFSEQPQLADQHLWDLCREKMSNESLLLSRSPVRWRAKGYWEKYHKESFTLSIHPLIIRLISSYLDQGQSFWANPYAEKGFWDFFCSTIESTKNFKSGWEKGLASKLENHKTSTPSQLIVCELTSKGIPESEWESYLLEILFDLKGWSGMVNKLELEPWQATVKAPPIKLVDYLAALVVLESSIDSWHAIHNSLDLSLIHGRLERLELKSFQLSLALYQITKNFKLEERWMQWLSAADLLKIIDEVDEAETTHKIRLWHEAYEHHFYREAIDAVSSHSRSSKVKKTPTAQVLFCIDDREESMRRHLEELDPTLATFGVVGFFGIDMKFSSLKNQRLIAQCPPVISPSRIIREVSRDAESGKSFKKLNDFLGGSDLSLYYNSRTLFRGFVSTLVLGVLSIVPMFLQIFFPKQSRLLSQTLLRILSPLPKTELSIGLGEAGHGYSKKEMASIVSAILGMCGIRDQFSSLIILIAHGSSSSNNPFKQAYGCGACGGNAGVPNSRAFAKMANDPEVREELRALGLDVPSRTTFVSGFHDTCTDEFDFYDLDHMPQEHQQEFTRIKNNLQQAGVLNAFERCQRFSSSEAKSSPQKAHRHVKERSLDLAQPRPEYGHSSNALAIVGKRDLTKGLFLNRRSFLISYDWEGDPEGSMLKQVILGAIPVCVNINMDYYFSCVDNDNFGCGSKLPLNLTSLLGVMTGSHGDLRIGLARQMVEIHEPIRNLTIIEAPFQRVKDIFDSHPRLRNMLYHHWMRLVIKDPLTGTWWLLGHKEFHTLEIEDAHLKHYHKSAEVLRHEDPEENFAEIDE
ncbi:MAG TPA: DUF2309 domain-containing protein [Bacteriovoracaceae bacterium]|nr:DUF2309 domain-containing protein [Bacteriovoracaceae bacterium]